MNRSTRDTESYECRPLTREQIRWVYDNRLVHDFPANERKEYSRIEDSLRRNAYACYGILSGERICAYAFLAVKPMAAQKRYLLDYFAVDPELRGCGLGSMLLQELSVLLQQDAELVLCEVEDPDRAETAAEHFQRQRRIQFYERNGFWESGVRVRAFGVPYRLLVLENGSTYTNKQVRRAYKQLYRTFLPCWMYYVYFRFSTDGDTKKA